MKKVVNGITFLKLKGSDVERARLHGSYLKEEIKKGVIPALAEKNAAIIKKSYMPKFLSPVKDLGVHFYHNILLPMMEKNLPEKYRAMARALADEVGLTESQILRALYQADGLMFLSKTSVMRYTFKDLNIAAFPGCSSSTVLKDWTEVGRPLMCRNQDYPIVGYWDPHPLVVFNESDEPGFIPHVSISTPGVFASGLTAMNEEGLCLSAHAHFGKKVSLKGMPIFYVGNEVISKAKSINEAIDLIRKIPRHANWAFILLDGKNNETCVVEMNPKEERIRYSKDGTISHSNYFHNEELKKDEALIAGGIVSDNLHRYCRMQDQLQGLKGKITVNHLAKIVGDSFDDKVGVHRIVGNTLSPITNIKSVVFDPLKQKFWMSNRLESPVSWGDFMEIEKNEIFKANFSPKFIEGKRPSEKIVKAMSKYREAFMLYMGNTLTDYEEQTLKLLDECLEIYNEDGNVLMVAGFVAFKMQLMEKAKKYFHEARNRNLGTHIATVCDLFIARLYDIEDKRNFALKIYQKYVDYSDPILRSEFKRGLKKSYSIKNAKTLAIDLQFPDLLHY
ncbi:MAG: C45 family peptidase [Bacteriovoracaceae bacterium]